jgi:hypothetical protein
MLGRSYWSGCEASGFSLARFQANQMIHMLGAITKKRMIITPRAGSELVVGVTMSLRTVKTKADTTPKAALRITQ